MKDYRSYKIVAISKALSPLTHNRGSEGNETVIATEEIQTESGAAQVPIISGNALRHCMVRSPGASYLVDNWDIKDGLPLSVLNFLFSGGSLWKKGATENVKKLRALWDLLPLYRVLGGSLPDQIVSGTLEAWRGVLVCAENMSRVESILPSGWVPNWKIMRARRMISGYQYTRNSPRSKLISSESVESAPDSSVQMIYNGQTVIPGAVFVHGYCLRDARELDVGAFLHALDRATGIIGAMSGRGHGHLETTYLTDLANAEIAELISAYESHVKATSADSLEFLLKEIADA